MALRVHGKRPLLYQEMDKADIKKTNGKLTERRLDPKKVVTSLQKVPTS